MRYPNFIGASYTNESRAATGERTTNWYLARNESEGAKSAYALFPTPGVTTLAAFPDAPGRALWSGIGRAFAVVGPTLYEVFADWSFLARGTVLTDDNPATIWYNSDGGNELFVTSQGAGYTYDLNTNVLTPIAALANPTCQMGGYLDTYFLSLNPTDSSWRISDTYDGLTWDPLQFKQRVQAADRWVSLLVVGKYIWLFGEQTSEVWYNNGGFPFPFAPVPNALINEGIGAAFSAVDLGGSPAWLGQSKDGNCMVFQANGYRAQRISDHGVEEALSNYALVSDARGWTYQQSGHRFYVLTFPTAEATWVYDAYTLRWHERDYLNPATGQSEEYRPTFHTFAFGSHLALDRASGDLLALSTKVYADVGGAAIRRRRRAPHLWSGGRRLFLSRLEVFLRSGVGLATGQGEDPELMLRVSHDGGETFGYEVRAPIGRMGDYLQRAEFHQLGSGDDLVIEVAASDPVPWQLHGAEVDMTAGDF